MPIEDLPPDIQGILTDPNNLEHGLYERGDPRVTAKVENAYKARYGDQQIDLSTSALQIKNPGEPTAQPAIETQPATQSSTSSEDDWTGFDLTPENMQSILRAELGDDGFDNAMKRAPQAAVKLFGDFPDQTFVKQLFALAGNHPSGYKLILHLDNLIRKGGR